MKQLIAILTAGIFLAIPRVADAQTGSHAYFQTGPLVISIESS